MVVDGGKKQQVEKVHEVQRRRLAAVSVAGHQGHPAFGPSVDKAASLLTVSVGRCCAPAYNIAKRFLRKEGRKGGRRPTAVITQVVGHIQYSYMRLGK